MKLLAFALLVSLCLLGRADDPDDPKPEPKPEPEPQKPVSQPLGVIGDYLTTSVGVGDPPQYFELFLDSNSDKLSIFDVKTFNEKIDYQYDYVKNLFVPEASETLELSESLCRLSYQEGGNNYHVSGVYGKDLITLGGQTFKDKKARFCDLNEVRDATSTSSDKIKWAMDKPIDGFLGIKPGGEEILTKIGLPANQLTFYMDSNAKESDNAGIVTFGGKDTANCGTFRSFESEDSDSLTAWVTKISFNNNKFEGLYSARFDFTNKTLVVPSDVYNAFARYFGNQMSSVFCSSYPHIPDLTLTIYGKEYKIPMQNILTPNSMPNRCSVSLTRASSSDEDQIVLNRYVLDNYCLHFDYAESLIGLADVKKK